jgi:hypothetical protein
MMSMLRRAPAREAESTPPPPAPPEFSSFRQKRKWKDAHNIVAIGPVDPHPPQPPPTRADEVAAARRASERRLAHVAIVEAELEALDAHARTVDARLASSAVGDYEMRELEAERRQLRALRAEIEADRNSPIAQDRDGRPLSDRMLRYIRTRAKELRDQSWRSAALAAAAGDHRRARQLRHDALRARHLSEREMHIRESLRGYSHA